jgi:hypothetical protein
MAERLQQIHQQLEPSDPVTGPDRIDGQVVIITGGAQGTSFTLFRILYIRILTVYLGRNRKGDRFAISPKRSKSSYQ